MISHTTGEIRAGTEMGENLTSPDPERSFPSWREIQNGYWETWNHDI